MAFTVRISGNGGGPVDGNCASARSGPELFYSTQAVAEDMGFIRSRELIEASKGHERCVTAGHLRFRHRRGCIYTNTAYQKISGLSFEATLGTKWSVAMHPEESTEELVAVVEHALG